MIKQFLILSTLLLITSCNKKEQYNCDIAYSNIVQERTTNYPSLEVEKINYKSDGLLITGYIIKPIKIATNEKLPLIIYNRGGNRDFGATTRYGLRYLKYLSSLGYVVMASEYRGNSFSEGFDEFGGDDINDVKCLIEIAKNSNYIDADNIGVLGYSRGGLMSFLLSKESDDIKTIVTVGAPTDLFLGSKNRPRLYKKVILELIGDSINHKQDYINRSAIYWTKQLNEPTLVIHGTADESVNVLHAKKLRDSLKNTSQKINIFLVEGGNHSVSNYRKERNDTIAKWFKQYLKKQ